MKIFIIGGTGVLSTDVVKECLKHGDDIYILNRGHNKPDYDSSEVHQIIADIREVDEVRGKLGGITYDVVVDFLSYRADQLESTFKLFAPLCKQYVFISSCCVFRRSREDGVISEESYKPNTVLTYGLNKYESELRLKELASESPCEYTIVRPYITYGNTRIPFGIAPRERYHWTIIGRILSGKPFFIWNEGENQCTLLHTSDFAKILYRIFLNPKAYNQDVNLTGNRSYRWIEVLNILYKKLGKDTKNIVHISQEDISELIPTFKESLLGDRALNAIFDNSKLFSIVPEAKDILERSISLEEGIAKTIESYKSNNYYSGIDFIYDARVDRMLYKYLESSDKRRKKIKYVDYLNRESFKCKSNYFIYRYFSQRTISVIRRLLTI